MNRNPIVPLQSHAAIRPQATAFWFGEEVWTYQRLARQSERLARGLMRFGLRKGDRVALHMSNRPEMLVAYAACFQIGLTAVPLHTAYKTAELLPLLNRLQPALYIGDTALYPNIAGAPASSLPLDRRVVVDGPVDDRKVRHWTQLIDDSDAEVPTVFDADTPAVLISTSGTTGEPKLVVHTHLTLSAIAAMICENVGLRAADIALGHLLLTHISGLASFLVNLRMGMAFPLMGTIDPDQLLNMIERRRVTLMIGFPSTYAALIERQSAQPRDVKSLRLCVVGADSCPLEVQARFREVMGVRLSNFWGATEALGSMTIGTQDGPVACLSEGAQFRLVDDKDNEVAAGEVGEACFRGSNIFRGYWNQPGATEDVLKDGWYHTGDLMRRGTGNEVWFVGRKKDIIIRAGVNISPIEVEEAIIAAHPAVQQAGVAGAPDGAMGQRVIGFVRLGPDAKAGVADDILHTVAQRLAAYKVPERLVVIDKLPLNMLGKVDRKVLAQMALAEG